MAMGHFLREIVPIGGEVYKLKRRAQLWSWQSNETAMI